MDNEKNVIISLQTRADSRLAEPFQRLKSEAGSTHKRMEELAHGTGQSITKMAGSASTELRKLDRGVHFLSAGFQGLTTNLMLSGAAFAGAGGKAGEFAGHMTKVVGIVATFHSAIMIFRGMSALIHAGSVALGGYTASALAATSANDALARSHMSVAAAAGAQAVAQGAAGATGVGGAALGGLAGGLGSIAPAVAGLGGAGAGVAAAGLIVGGGLLAANTQAGAGWFANVLGMGTPGATAGQVWRHRRAAWVPDFVRTRAENQEVAREEAAFQIATGRADMMQRQHEDAISRMQRQRFDIGIREPFAEQQMALERQQRRTQFELTRGVSLAGLGLEGRNRSGAQAAAGNIVEALRAGAPDIYKQPGGAAELRGIGEQAEARVFAGKQHVQAAGQASDEADEAQKRARGDTLAAEKQLADYRKEARQDIVITAQLEHRITEAKQRQAEATNDALAKEKAYLAAKREVLKAQEDETRSLKSGAQAKVERLADERKDFAAQWAEMDPARKFALEGLRGRLLQGGRFGQNVMPRVAFAHGRPVVLPGLVGGLNPAELQAAKGFGPLGELVHEQAAAAGAADPRFGAFMQGLPFAARQQQAAQQVIRLDANLKNEINAVIQFDKDTAKELHDKFIPQIVAAVKGIVNQFKAELNAKLAEAHALQQGAANAAAIK